MPSGVLLWIHDGYRGNKSCTKGTHMQGKGRCSLVCQRESRNVIGKENTLFHASCNHLRLHGKKFYRFGKSSTATTVSLSVRLPQKKTRKLSGCFVTRVVKLLLNPTAVVS